MAHAVLARAAGLEMSLADGCQGQHVFQRIHLHLVDGA